MQKRMPYSLYKGSYSEFPSSDYDKVTRTILVDLPNYKKPRFPKTWEKWGNHYSVDTGNGGALVSFWGAGLAENFTVEASKGYYNTIKHFSGLYARENVIKYINSL